MHINKEICLIENNEFVFAVLSLEQLFKIVVLVAFNAKNSSKDSTILRPI